MATPSSSPGYKTVLEACDMLGRTQPCVLGYIKDGQLAGQKGADNRWYISDLSLAAFLQRRNLTSGARALTEVDKQNERIAALETRFTEELCAVNARLDKLTAGMKIMLAHLKKG
jgi:hypothetical protein